MPSKIRGQVFATGGTRRAARRVARSRMTLDDWNVAQLEHPYLGFGASLKIEPLD
jgi:hypothetical protein